MIINDVNLSKKIIVSPKTNLFPNVTTSILLPSLYISPFSRNISLQVANSSFDMEFLLSFDLKTLNNLYYTLENEFIYTKKYFICEYGENIRIDACLYDNLEKVEFDLNFLNKCSLNKRRYYLNEITLKEYQPAPNEKELLKFFDTKDFLNILDKDQ